jgi:concanavalin A-like lectin/glucanase superfamily protein
MPRRVSVLGGIVVVACLVVATPAVAATLVGDYQFQGTRGSSGPGPAVTDVGAGPDVFQTDTVMGSSRQVLAFPLHGGVRISPAGLSPGAYSVVTTFRLDDLTGYRRILDPSNGTNDAGFYEYSGGADYYYVLPHTPGEEYNSAIVLTDHVYATAVLTVVPPSQSRFYVNGALQVTSTEGLVPVGDTLRLFKDNDTSGTPDEDSAGAVSCIRVYSGALTDNEVAGIGASATCGKTGQRATALARCKKRAHKHHWSHKRLKRCKKKANLLPV